MSEISFTASSAKLFQEAALGVSLSSRKLLSDNPVTSNHHVLVPVPAMAPAQKSGPNGLDANVLMVMSVLVCGCFCSLGLHYIIRCVLRCSTRMVISDTGYGPSPSDGGSANRGIKKRALKTFPVVSYSPEKNLPGLDEECVICLSEFESGELLRILPKCNHGFHVRCIDKWLKTHSSCPKCRHSLIETCQKIMGFSREDATSTSTSTSSTSSMTNSSAESTATGEESVTVSIEPLQPEGRVNNLRESI